MCGHYQSRLVFGSLKWLLFNQLRAVIDYQGQNLLPYFKQLENQSKYMKQ